MPGVEPHLSLAFAVEANPGGYAILTGAGISRPAGVLSAWEVLRSLLQRLASAAGIEPGDPFEWYGTTYGEPATYDRVLGLLAFSSDERMALLRSYFEPTEEERERGIKTPTTAHREIATLAAAGLVKLILTTNFDLLHETALRDAGVEPVIASTEAAVEGMSPLHTQRCVVVHLHGDYLTPGMLNTADELVSYPDAINQFLDRVFDEYGVVVAGWSADWDVALRNAMERVRSGRFTTYWVNPSAPSEHARRVIAQRHAVVSHQDADGFFSALAAAVEGLREVSRHHPASIDAGVAAAKRELASGRYAVRLHDAIRHEVERVSRSAPMATTDYSEAPETLAQRRAALDAELELLIALVATAAYWGSPETDDWWLGDVATLAEYPEGASGSTSLIELKQYPGIAIGYSAGVAAIARGRWDLIAKLVHVLTTDRHRGGRHPVLLAGGTGVSCRRC